MTAAELKELLLKVPDDRELVVLISGDSKQYPIFDLGYDGAADVEVIMAEER